MPEDNVELSRRLVEAWNQRDAEATIVLADSEMVWRPVMEEIVEGQIYRGHAGIRQYFDYLAEQSATSRAGDFDLRDLGDQVLGLGRLWLTASGIELNQDIAFLHTWRDGKCIEARTWLSHAEALEAAGLSDG